MGAKNILKQLEKNKSKTVKAVDIFSMEINNKDIRKGVSFKEIVKEIKRASKEGLLITHNATFK